MNIENFSNELSSLIKLEQQLEKIYLKLEKAAFSPELAKALSPVSTDHPQHLSRLTLIKKGDTNQTQTAATTIIPKIKLSVKNKDPQQDLEIIAYAIKLQYLKLGYYEFLHPLASAVQMEAEASLIEQTIIDNRNTTTWLRQLVKNVVVPQIEE